MPGGDRRGPMGQGPRTGGGMGFCSGYAGPGYGRGWRGYRFGFGGGRFACGRGLGQRRLRDDSGRFAGWAVPSGYPTPDAEAEARILRQEADALRRQLEDVQQRLAAMQPPERPEE